MATTTTTSGGGLLLGRALAPMGQYWGMRIVSLLPSATEIVYALGLEGHLVGVTDECDWPPQARTVRMVSRSTPPTVAEPAGPGCQQGAP